MAALSRVRGLRQIRRGVFATLEAAIFAMVLAIVVLVTAQVFTRYVLELPVNWLEEAARMILVWLVMLGAAVAAERKEHYVIDFIVRGLPRKVALLLLLITNVLGIVFLAILAMKGIQYFESALRTFYVSLNVPRGYVYVALPVGALLMAFSLVTQSIEALLVPPNGAPPLGTEPAFRHE